MDKSKNSQKVVFTVGPPDSPYAKIMRVERRLGLKDRRRLNTNISNDRRFGILDRRKFKEHRLKRLRTEDRRQLHTYLAKDRRSGIADRRKAKRTNHLGGKDNK